MRCGSPVALQAPGLPSCQSSPHRLRCRCCTVLYSAAAQCAGGFACLDCNEDYKKCTRCGMGGFQYLATNHTCQWVSRL